MSDKALNGARVTITKLNKKMLCALLYFQAILTALHLVQGQSRCLKSSPVNYLCREFG